MKALNVNPECLPYKKQQIMMAGFKAGTPLGKLKPPFELCFLFLKLVPGSS
jgi:hypothetical protein